MLAVQDDIDEVNKIAHNLKARLDNLGRMNEAALKRKVGFQHSACLVKQGLQHCALLCSCSHSSFRFVCTRVMHMGRRLPIAILPTVVRRHAFIRCIWAACAR